MTDGLAKPSNGVPVLHSSADCLIQGTDCVLKDIVDTEQWGYQLCPTVDWEPWIHFIVDMSREQ